MNFKGILFDLDGTLINTTPLILQSFEHTVRVHFNRELDPLEAIKYFGKPLRAAMENLDAEKVEELVNTYREYNHKNHDELTKAFTGVAETIRVLYEHGIQMAIVTSKTKEMAERGLKLFYMQDYFSVIIGVGQTQNHKPHPEPVLAALMYLQLKAEDCLMVGDSPFDIISAQAAGVKTAAVKWSAVPWADIEQAKPEYVLADMADLLTICGIEK